RCFVTPTPAPIFNCRLHLALALAVDAAVGVVGGQFKDVVDPFLHRADAAGVAAADDVDQPFGEGELFLFDHLALLDKGDGDVVVDVPEKVEVQPDIPLDFDDVLSAVAAAAGVADEDDGAV